MCFLKIAVNDGRFEAHMEMHVGSVDEEEHEQGIAHMIEHVAFLGSKKREKLLGTGARSNAYTDFHHTVFHVHSPVTTQVAVLKISLFLLTQLLLNEFFLNFTKAKDCDTILLGNSVQEITMSSSEVSFAHSVTCMT